MDEEELGPTENKMTSGLKYSQQTGNHVTFVVGRASLIALSLASVLAGFLCRVYFHQINKVNSI